MAPFDTGSPRDDAQGDFVRQRRRQVLARLAARLRREPWDVNVVLPYEEVVDALGIAATRDAGLESVALETIVGSVGRAEEFDRGFRPTSSKTRERWQRMAEAQRRGESFPPVSLYRVEGLHFVRDGHHRVSVARALGHETIEAYVTEVRTRIGTEGRLRLVDLPLKGHQRMFQERVPLPPDAARRIRLDDPWQYGALAEGVEAWGFRAIQERGEPMSREEVARAWFDEEYEPVVAVLNESGLIGDGTEAEAYMRVVTERYRLMRTHEWSPDIWDRLTRELR